MKTLNKINDQPIQTAQYQYP